MSDEAAAILAAMTSLLGLAVFAAVYLFSAFVLYRIGRKFKKGTFWEYCIPIYNSVLICRCAGITPWHLIWLFIPLANIVFIVYLWGAVAQRLGHNFWIFGLGIFLFAIPILILAFDGSMPAQPASAVVQTVAGPTIYCLSGEFAGNRVPLNAEGVIIGRSPNKANLILSSLDISAMHARVWCDREGRVWVQDMSSSNGTYYSRAGDGAGHPEWVEVKTPVALASGSHVRLGDNIAEFVVS